MKKILPTTLLVISLILLVCPSIAQPPEPILIQEWGGFNAGRFAIDEGYAWGLGGSYQDPELYQLDLTGDENGEFVLDLPSRCNGLDAENGLLILAAGWEGIYLLDISDPENVTWLSTFHMPGEPQDVVIQNGYAYVACSYSGLVTVDVSNPLSPQITQYYLVGEADTVTELAVTDDLLIVAANNYGYVSFSLADSAHPAPVDTLQADHGFDSNLSNLTITDGRLSQPFVEWGTDGWDFFVSFYLHIASIQSGHFDTLGLHYFGTTSGGAVANAALDGTTLIASMYDDLGIYDVSDPTQLDPYFFYPDSTLGSMIVQGDILYAQKNGGFKAFSLSGDRLASAWQHDSEERTRYHRTSSAPVRNSHFASANSQFSDQIAETDDWIITQLGTLTLDPSVEVHDMLSHGDAVYILQQEYQEFYVLETIHILDVSDPNEPSYSGVVPHLNGVTYDMTITDDVMIAAVRVGLKLFDISDPLNPTWTHTIQLEDTLNYIAACGDRLYGYNAGKLLSYDISDPDNPILLDALVTGRYQHAAISPDGQWLVLARRESWATDPFDHHAFGIADLLALDWTGNRPYMVKEISIGSGDYYYINAIGFNGFQFQTSYHVFDGHEWSRGTSLVHDISEPFYPQLILEDNRDFFGPPSRAMWHDDYLLYGLDGLNMYDISDPEEPNLLLQEDSVPWYHMSLEWPYLYASDGNDFIVYLLDATAVGESNGISSSLMPNQIAITSAYPNPFNDALTVEITVSKPGTYSLRVLNTLGQQVDTVELAYMKTGVYKQSYSLPVGSSSGIYFVQAIVPGQMNEMRKVVYLK